MRGRGQSLVELAVCLPVLVELALAGVAAARVADARAGLDGALQAALAAAARAPDAASAEHVVEQEFAADVAAYPLQGATVTLDGTAFTRSALWSATAVGWVDVSFVPLPGLPRRLYLETRAVAVVEPWRSR